MYTRPRTSPPLPGKIEIKILGKVISSLLSSFNEEVFFHFLQLSTNLSFPLTPHIKQTNDATMSLNWLPRASVLNIRLFRVSANPVPEQTPSAGTESRAAPVQFTCLLVFQEDLASQTPQGNFAH